eukprot:COSAG05_NODE_10059_length_585_cov_1.041152_1_plen_167_part_01
MDSPDAEAWFAWGEVDSNDSTSGDSPPSMTSSSGQRSDSWATPFSTFGDDFAAREDWQRRPAEIEPAHPPQIRRAASAIPQALPPPVSVAMPVAAVERQARQLQLSSPFPPSDADWWSGDSSLPHERALILLRAGGHAGPARPDHLLNLEGAYGRIFIDNVRRRKPG